MDTAYAPMHVTVLGDYLGIHLFEVTDDHVRESSQRNYTAKLSLKPIRRLFEEVDMTERVLTLARDVDGDYWLSIE
ncbi:hypothetical protein EDC03_2386 [Pseudokineococcus lusitanus]|uniref:Uncharacterized protein n=2 Tax=Pseudokineococcus lusitanus TaxID=763993 RepID=A0A3N1GWD8_9ACTN|nr:hypothetical protein EDC03_2386 [Pseudokineococcus lusitanus]